MADETVNSVDTGTSTSSNTDTTYKAKSYQQTLDDLNTMYSNNQASINSMYDAQLASQKANLESAYQNNLSNYEASAKTLEDNYNTNANTLAQSYERQRRNNAIQATANGLNSGAQSQMALASTNSYQNNVGNLAKQYQADLAENQRNIDNLTAEYNISVNEAIANNDYERASKLFDEYNNNYTRMSEAESQAYSRMTANADNMAQYGDFSGYAALGYTDEQIAAMETQWLYNNPLLAYNLGKIDAARYKALTGSDAPGTSSSYYSGTLGTEEETEDLYKEIDELKAAKNEDGTEKYTTAEIVKAIGEDSRYGGMGTSTVNKYENYANGRDLNYYYNGEDR